MSLFAEFPLLPCSRYFSIFPPPPFPLISVRFRCIVSVGTQRGFYPNVYTLVQNLRSKPNYCKNANQVVVNRFFAPTFQIDWCRTELVLYWSTSARSICLEKYYPSPRIGGYGRSRKACSAAGGHRNKQGATNLLWEMTKIV